MERRWRWSVLTPSDCGVHLWLWASSFFVPVVQFSPSVVNMHARKHDQYHHVAYIQRYRVHTHSRELLSASLELFEGPRPERFKTIQG